MKKSYLLLLLPFFGISQNGAPASPYYDGFIWSYTGTDLKTALATKIINTHTNFLTYTPGVWEAAKATDLDPNNSSNVLLVYGWESGSDTDVTNDLSRGVNKNSGANGDWNREHVFAKSLGNPKLDDANPSDAGEDAHHLRSADVQRNAARGNLKFAAGSGNSSTVTGGWYPGDRWKGDIARMMMYTYLRYGTQCLPTAVGTGDVADSDSNMVKLFLQWNAEDPVDQYEDNRNTYHGDTSNAYAQGNRNPFIDNPYLATLIWGGTPAQNRWSSVFLSKDSFNILSNVQVYPNPTNDHRINIDSEKVLDQITITTINGQVMVEIKNPVFNDNHYSINNIPSGFYFLKLSSNSTSIVKKIVIN